MNKKHLDIPAVWDKDLRTILSDIGILDQFEAHSLQCKYCDQPLGWHNLGAVAIEDSRLVFICDTAECLGDASIRSK